MIKQKSIEQIKLFEIGTLAPNRRKMLSELGMKALFAGSLASLLFATILGTIQDKIKMLKMNR